MENPQRKLLPYDPAFPLLGTDPKEFTLGYWRESTTPVFPETLLMIAEIWKQLRCPLIDGRILKCEI